MTGELVEAAERPDLEPVDAVLDRMGSPPGAGLTTGEATRRLSRIGRNELPAPPRTPLVLRLLAQLREPMAILLLVAATISGVFLGEAVDAVAIGLIVLLNAVIALVQEGRATRALEALRELEVPHARVRRDGLVAMVPAPELVPGDMVLVEAGNRAPADLRLVSGDGLEMDESALTGESLPVAKDPGRLARPDATLGERPAMLFSGTFVARGSGSGVVVATGPRTALGRIAREATAARRRTPLQDELSDLTGRLGAIAVVIAAGVLALTIVRHGLTGEGLREAFLAAVALAVAAVPEGLATVTAVALALGVRRMAEHGAIIRRLPAVETLGSASVLAIDKTGTLTRNQMVLSEAAPADGDFRPLDDLNPGVRRAIEQVAVLCNDAELDPLVGDPTETALLAAFDGAAVAALRSSWKRRATAPFDSIRKRMVTLQEDPDGLLELQVKGAPEALLPDCGRILTNGGETTALTESARTLVCRRADEAAARGTRVLALARRRLGAVPADVETAVSDLELVGLVGLRDPVRESAPQSAREARSAGITLLMATGDHPGTAAAVAAQVELTADEPGVRTGRELRAEGIGDDPTRTRIYARVDPDQKLELVERLQREGHIVAMTGDGVNDAPALRRADIGIALGQRGSDVAREAADMVITDDDLATIVTAIREGRGIYDNIRKVVDYLLAGNLGEILVVVAGLVIFPQLGVPLLPVQLLWINLLTDGLPAIALGVDPIDQAVMRRPPRPRGSRLLTGRRFVRMLVRGALIATATLASLVLARVGFGATWTHARAVMFTTLVIAGLLYAYAVRGGITGNRSLLWATLGSIAAQAIIVALPAAHAVFGTATLSLAEWAMALALGAAPAITAYALDRFARSR